MPPDDGIPALLKAQNAALTRIGNLLERIVEHQANPLRAAAAPSDAAPMPAIQARAPSRRS